ncbi:MAG: putative LPS assembly protein LptD [Candidatus Krumholzibacteriia bacterium]
MIRPTAPRFAGPWPALVLSVALGALSAARGPAQESAPAAGAVADSAAAESAAVGKAAVAAVAAGSVAGGSVAIDSVAAGSATADSTARAGGGPPVLPGFTLIRSRGPLVSRVQDGEPVTILTDSVLVARDSLTVTADSAFYYRTRELYDFRGRVKLVNGNVVLHSRRTVLSRREDAADSEGDVRVEENGVVGTAARGESRAGGALTRLIGEARLVSPEYTVWADTIVQHRDEDRGEAFGRVRLLDPESRTYVTGGRAVFHRREGVAVVDRGPSLTTRENGEGALAGTSRLMRFQREPDRIVMVDSVRIRQGRQEAVADTAVVIGRERVLLRGSPTLRDGEHSTMSGREIDLLYRDDALDRVLLRGAARVEDTQPDSLARYFPGLPAANVLEGDTITVQMAAGEIRRTTVLGAAHSLYVPEDVSDEIASNDVKGDTISIDFRRGKVDVVGVSGHMSGTYSFVRRADLAGAPGDSAAAAVGGAAPGPAAPPGAPATGAAAADTGKAPVILPGGADFSRRRENVVYSGHAAVFRLGERSIDITRDASLTYGTLNLDARHVRFDTVRRELYADGEPLLEDSAQKIAGDQMGYNFGVRSGAVRDGVTMYDNSYYTGREIKRFADGTLKIRSGRMTSCDLARPHYHFWADRMKIRMGDKVVASPVVLKIGEVPVFALPVYFKSLKSGRRSGILFPNFGFGWTSREGRFVRDWGYYWATNDYLDFTLRGDYNENRNLALRLTNRYVKRYAYTGGFDWSSSRGIGGDTRVKEWQLRWNHNQEALFDVYTLRGDVQLASRTLTRNDLTSNVNRDVISGQLHSTVFVSRNWQNASGSLNLTRDQQVNAADADPATDNVLATATMPQMNVSFRRRPILAPLPSGAHGSLPGDLLRAAYYTHSYAVSRQSTSRELTDQELTSARGDLALEWRPPRLGFLNISSGVQSSQLWQRTVREGRAFAGWDTTFVEPDSLVRNAIFSDVRDVVERTSPALSINTSAGATFYGLFPIGLGALQAIRHTLALSASHGFRPGLGDKQPRSSVFSFSMDNRFDVKLRGGGTAPARTAGGSPDERPTAAGGAGGGGRDKAGGRKLDGVLDWRLSASFDPNAASGRGWSTLSSGILIKPGQSRNLNFRLDNSIDPYKWRVLSTRVTYGLNLSGRLDTGAQAAPPPERISTAIDRLGAPADSAGAAATGDGRLPHSQPDDTLADEFAGFRRIAAAGEGKDPTEGGRYVPWNLSTSISYSSLSGAYSSSTSSSARANVSLSASPTRGWALTWSASYDAKQGVTMQNWGLVRDLHCWELEFSRMISEVDTQFGFRIYLKSIPSIEFKQGVGDIQRTAGLLGGGF